MSYKERYPDFLEETMFAATGAKVLISDPTADVYLEQARLRKVKEKYPQWVEGQENN